MSDDFEKDLDEEESENDMSDEELLRRKSSLDDDFADTDELGAETDLDPLVHDPLAADSLGEDEPESLDEKIDDELEEEDEWDDVEPDEM
jgi:hypothetical protein